MACHYAKWTLSDTQPDLRRLNPELATAAAAFSVKRRQRYLHGRGLLAEMMAYFYGIPLLPKIITPPSGRPCFADTNLPDFSLAYAGNTLGVMLSSEGKVGLDMEVIRARSSRILQLHNAHLSSAEQAWVAEQNEPMEASTQLWCIRQSVLKLSGLGNSGLNTVRLHPASARLRSSVLPDVQVASDSDSLFAWACAQSPTLGRMVQWRYHPDTGFSQIQESLTAQQALSSHFMKMLSLPPTR